MGMPLLAVPPEVIAELDRARARHREALRRVNQDWTAYGAVERTNQRRLEDARRDLDVLTGR